MIAEILKDAVNKAMEALGLEQVAFTLEHPDNTDHGDYAINAALILSKKMGKNPKEIAEMLKAEIEKSLPKEVEKVEIAGPGFINFYLTKLFFKTTISDVIEKGKEFGKGELFKGTTWAVEYASPNPNKAMHLGHLRNTVTGVAFCNLLEINGAKVIREMVDNNRGIAIAKLMWGYLVSAKKDGARIEDVSYWQSHKDEWHTPESAGKSPDMFADELYVKGSDECKDPENEQKVRDLVVAWEAKDTVVWDLWETVLNFAYAGQKKTLDRLSARFDYIWHEHEHYEKGKAYVAQGLEKGIFKKLEDGAIITDLESFGLTDTVVEKKDGTSLYITQDLALTDLKKKKHGADHMVWVIGPEQSLAMQQMFAVCEQLGIAKKEECTHIAYGYVTIKGQGKMSSRTGNVVYADELLNEIKAKAATLMKDRVDQADIDAISEMIAHGSVVFELLKMGRMKDSAFDMEAALSFEGDSGPYLQYAVTRAHSVLRKASEAGIDAAVSAEDFEVTQLERLLYRFPEVVAQAGKDYAPQIVTTYLTELAGVFNSWYGNHVIVSDIPEAPYRVALTKAFTHVMENGLSILAIPVPSKM